MQQQGHYANECPQKNLHCKGDPNDDEQYDEYIKMEQPDIEPHSKSELPLKFTNANESPLLISFTGAF